MKAGDTFTAPEYEQHLWIVLSDPEKDPSRVLIVNVTTYRPDKDPSCILRPGEHRFIQHNSCINYQDANLADNAKLDSGLSRAILRSWAPLTPDILERVRMGAALSRFLAVEYRQLLVDQALIEED